MDTIVRAQHIVSIVRWTIQVPLPQSNNHHGVELPRGISVEESPKIALRAGNTQ